MLLAPCVQGDFYVPGMLQCLLESGEECGFTSLMMASEGGDSRVVRVLLAAGANKEAKDMVGGGRSRFVEKWGCVRGAQRTMC